MSRAGQVKKNDEVRKKIIKEAAKIISEDGVEQLSIRKITNALDYSPGIIYHYFKDKEEIVEEVRIYGENVIASIMRDKINPNGSTQDNIINVFKAIMYAAMNEPEHYKISTLGRLAKDGDFNGSGLISLTSGLKKGMDSGEIKKGDPMIIATIIQTSFLGLTLRIIQDKNMTEEMAEVLFDENVAMLFRGILK